nr:aldehyde dehydrogenase family protein [uncultured Rhodoferax sp.]
MSDTKQFLDPEQWKSRIFDGQWCVALGGNLVVREPATGEVLAEIGQANAADAENAIKAAVQAQRRWAKLPSRERAGIFRRAAEILQTNAAELAMWVVRETGSIMPKAQLEINEATELFNMAAAMQHDSQGSVLPSQTGRLSYARRIPHGVVAVISPFNFPLILSMRAVGPALAAGNAVVLKPDPKTPVSGGLMIAAVLHAAGLPKGVLHVLPGGVEPGSVLCESPLIRMIAFTGSTAVGRSIAETAGRTLKKVTVELGGKSPLLILNDADLDIAASNAAWGAFLHQGQICMASGRILVQENIADEFISRFVKKDSQLSVGNPATGNVSLGPLISEIQRNRVHSIIQDSIEAGAILETGETYEQLFYKPTVLSNVTPGMRAYHEEVFGPCASIITFKTDDEAIAIANDTEYGLSAGIISSIDIFINHDNQSSTHALYLSTS